MSDCLFCRIVGGEIPAQIVDSTDEAVVVRDVNPQAPAHALVIPRRHATDLGDFVVSAHEGEVGRLFALAAKTGRAAGGEGYRLVVNEGTDGGQTVFHLHVHVLAGRPMRWPPG